jgi:hypothetical protein
LYRLIRLIDVARTVLVASAPAEARADSVSFLGVPSQRQLRTDTVAAAMENAISLLLSLEELEERLDVVG